MRKIRTSITHGHSHVFELPDTPPERPDWFFTETDPKDGHGHSIKWGGSELQFGVFPTDTSYSDNDDEHMHIFEVLV